MDAKEESIKRALAAGWLYDCECLEAGVGWTRLKRTRNYGSRQRIDFEYVAPDGRATSVLEPPIRKAIPSSTHASAHRGAGGASDHWWVRGRVPVRGGKTVPWPALCVLPRRIGQGTNSSFATVRRAG